MDILEENFGAVTSPVTLEDLVATDLPPLALPKASVRNRAATTAMLTGNPDKAVENYQAMMLEGEGGKSSMQKDFQAGILKATKDVDMQGIMSMLGDPKVSFDDKQRIVKGVKGSQFLSDSGTILHSNSLAAPSKGENAEQESSRISAADSIREIYDARSQIQGLVNAHGASLRNPDAGTVGEMAALWVMPFGNSVSTAKINKGINPTQSLWQTIKGFVAPGTTVANIRAQLENLPPAQRMEFTRKTLDSIKDNSGIIFGNDNQFAQWEKASAIFEEGGYGTFQEWADNISPILDVVGLGQVIRGSAKGAKAASKESKAAARVAPTDAVIKAEWGLADESTGAAGRMSSREIAEPDLVNLTRIKRKEVGPYTGPTVTGPAQTELMNPQLKLGVNSRQVGINMDDQIQRIESNSIIRQENPASPANIVQQANPEKARAIHEAVIKSSSDEVAEAFYGTNKSQAIINDVFPQVVTESGAVTAKVADIGRNLRKELQVSDEVIDMIHDTGATYYTRAEKAAVSANLVNDFKSAEGFVVNDAETGFSIVGGRVKIDAMYGTAEGGFLKAEDAMAQALFALRNTGVPAADITLMKKQGLDYVPTTLEEVSGIDGSYKIRISSYSDITPSSVHSFESIDVKRNIFDSIPGLVSDRKGSLARYLMDAASMLPSVITGPAVVAVDGVSKFEKLMLSEAAKFSDAFVTFSKDRKAAVNSYITEANYNGIAYDKVDLMARGFDGAEIKALGDWRNFWDGHFYLENYDAVRTLDAQGYRMFKNAKTELYVKPVPENQNIGRFYDPATDSVISHTQAAGDALYKSGGTYAKLRRPADFNGSTVEYMIVRNTPTEYTRKFNSTDSVLNYRDGYFQLQYKKNAKFVDEVDGDVTRTVAVAGDSLEATAFASRMKAADPSKDYKVRGDIKGLRRDGDEWWDINSASGRIAQRQRGKLLQDASGLNHLGDGSYIVNPVDSAVRAAKSISGRTVNRPMLEAAKARFVSQFGDMLSSNGAGGKGWPSNVDGITTKGEFTTKQLRDARTAYEYINYLENGYINTIDDVVKAGFNAIASILGKYSAGGSKVAAKLERGALLASEATLSTSLKSGVYLTYIVSNIFRQWIVQPHQAGRMLAYNPVGFANGGIMKLAVGYASTDLALPGFTRVFGKGFELLGDVTRIKTPHLDHDGFYKFIKSSGLLDSVDKSNLVRGTLLDAADTSNPIARNISKYAVTPARKIGFDVGEMANLLLHSAAVFERRVRKGENLGDLVKRDEAYSEIRALSGDMNFAGDMPYNQTSPAMLMQFMQVGHKMMLQATNRRLSVADRFKLVALDMIMFGSPAVAVASWLNEDILPEDPVAREALVWGLEAAMLNKSLSALADRPVSLDISALSPYDLSGWKEFFTHIATGGPVKAILSSPAGTLFMKDGGRVRTAIDSMSRFFGFSEDMDETPESALQVAKEVAKVLSGVNNLTKAQMILDTGKTWDKTGRLTDEGLGVTEAVAMVFGFPTTTTRDMFKSIKENGADVKAHKERVTQDIKAIMAYYTTALATDNADPQWITKVAGKVLKTYKNDPVAHEIMDVEITKALRSKDQILIDSMMKVIDIPSLGSTRDRIMRLPVSEEQRQQLLRITEDVENIREINREEK